MRTRMWPLLGYVAAIIACASDSGSSVTGPPEPGPNPGPEPIPTRDTTGVPLTDMGTLGYKGFPGGLYPGGFSTMPTNHAGVGTLRGQAVQPLDANGNPNANGKYVLISVGMSNTSDEFCGPDKFTSCDPTTFIPIAAADASVNHTTLVIVNGAQGGDDAVDWDSPTKATYEVVRNRLAAFNVTEKQVQVVWLKQADSRPTVPLPVTDGDAFQLETFLGKILRSLKIRYPNLKQVFLSSRTYGGYAITTTNPEPFAFETGLSVKWTVAAQINQIATGVVDPRAGDLNYDTVAPWIAWGPYLWANGTTPRSDGLIWVQSDFRDDGTHPNASGALKVATLLINFFKTSPQTKCWFVKNGTCG
jgi:hypothetical protein